jgi:hypothetical protein
MGYSQRLYCVHQSQSFHPFHPSILPYIYLTKSQSNTPILDLKIQSIIQLSKDLILQLVAQPAVRGRGILLLMLLALCIALCFLCLALFGLFRIFFTDAASEQRAAAFVGAAGFLANFGTDGLGFLGRGCKGICVEVAFTATLYGRKRRGISDLRVVFCGMNV